MHIFRPERLAMLRMAVVVLKERGWPEKWRRQLTEISVEGTTQAAMGMNILISTLKPDEWDSLDLPVPAKDERPPSARRIVSENPKKYRGRTKEERIAARKVLWMPVFVAEAERQHQAGEHISFMSIADGTCGALHMSFNAVYDFVRLQCNGTEDRISLKTLNPDGTPVVGKALSHKSKELSQKPPSGGVGPEEDGPSESDEDRQSRIGKQYADAFSKLEPGKHTRENLAQALGKPPYVVDAYLYQDRDLAEKLIDGRKLFDPKFLTNPG